MGVEGASVYRKPVQVDTLNTEMCVAISCGQYHTGALTHDARFVLLEISTCVIENAATKNTNGGGEI